MCESAAVCPACGWRSVADFAVGRGSLRRYAKPSLPPSLPPLTSEWSPWEAPPHVASLATGEAADVGWLCLVPKKFASSCASGGRHQCSFSAKTAWAGRLRSRGPCNLCYLLKHLHHPASFSNTCNLLLLAHIMQDKGCKPFE